ncbi:cell division cycle protein 123-like [Pelomyxa schiedti]|nr:cell division cycle protein 123-like [Pelomyxa schiedti]
MAADNNDRGVMLVLHGEDGVLHGDAEERKQTLLYRKLFEMDSYIHHLAGHTFRTSFIDVTLEEGIAWKLFNMGRSISEMTSAQATAFQNLHTKLESAISEMLQTAHCDRVFVKLSTRSPKDAVDKVPEKLLPFLKKIMATASFTGMTELEQSNAKLIILRKAFFQTMGCSNADDALYLISRSYRTISDIKIAMDNLDQVEWHMKIIIREFVDIDIGGEFRGFVHNRQLNALSQYYADTFFPRTTANVHQIAPLVQKFFNDEIRDKIPMDNYVIDFAVSEDLHSVSVVELNPFARTTGSCLFDWEKDATVIQNGPFEYRVIQAPLESVTNLLSVWDSIWEQLEAGSSSTTITKPTPTPSAEDAPWCMVM